MIIKIQTSVENDRWLIVENARNVMYSDKGIEHSPADFLALQSPDEYRSVWHSRPDPSKTSLFNHISYYLDEKRCEKLFDGMAYICNDEGKTVHKIMPKGSNYDNVLEAESKYNKTS